MSNAFFSFELNVKMFSTVKTKKEMMKKPQKQINTPMVLPKKVFGKMSPYPTLVNVMITFQIQLIMFEKFYEDISLSLASKILS